MLHISLTRSKAMPETSAQRRLVSSLIGGVLHNSKQYDDLVQSLDFHGYAVTLGEHGYRVTSHADPSDVSYARHLDDLADLAELMQWQAQYGTQQQQGE